jgi:hypothetical protein
MLHSSLKSMKIANNLIRKGVVLSKKLIIRVAITVAIISTPFLTFIIREKIAASAYVLSEKGHDYLLSCQGAFAASWREDAGLVSYLGFLHYPMSLRGCSCAADHIENSQPDAVETARIIFVGIHKSMNDASDDLLSHATALGDELRVSEARLTELVIANGNAIRECS